MSVGTTGGSAIWNDLQVTLNGSGTDIWGTSDQFEYAYQDCFRDYTITARVASLQNTDPWAKAGIMVKQAAATPLGGSYGFFADPDGHVWEVIHHPLYRLGTDGRPEVP